MKMRRNHWIALAFVINLLISMSVSSLIVNADTGTPQWSIEAPMIAFVNESVTVNISGPAHSPFILTLKNDTMANLLFRQYMTGNQTSLTNLTGSFIFNYTFETNGTYYIFIGDGEQYFTSMPAIIMVVINQETDPNTLNERNQDKRISDLEREATYQADVIQNMKGWLYMLLVIVLFLAGCLFELIVYYWHHSIHEHFEYWSGQSPVQNYQYRRDQASKSSQHDRDNSLKGLPKMLNFIVGNKIQEVDGFQQRISNPRYYDQLHMNDLKDVIKNASPSGSRRQRIATKASTVCPVCGMKYNAWGPGSICPGCGAEADPDKAEDMRFEKKVKRLERNYKEDAI